MKKTAALLSCIAALAISGNVYAAEMNEAETEISMLKERLTQLEDEVKKQKQQIDEGTVKVESVEKKQKTEETKRKNEFKFSGDARIRAIDSETSDGYVYDERIRINMEKSLDHDVVFKMRTIFLDDNEFGKKDGDDKARIDSAHFEFKNLYGNKNNQLRLGRYILGFGSKSSSFGSYDGVEFTTGNDKLKMSIGLGDWGARSAIEKNYYICADYKASKATNMGMWYLKETNANEGIKDFDLKGIGLKSRFSKNFGIALDYINNTGMPSGDKDTKWMTVYYKDANYNVPKSYGVQLYYRDAEKGSMNNLLAVTGTDISSLGYKGPGIGLEYVPFKNIKTMFRMAFHTKDTTTGEKKDNYYRFEVNCKF